MRGTPGGMIVATPGGVIIHVPGGGVIGDPGGGVIGNPGVGAPGGGVIGDPGLGGGKKCSLDRVDGRFNTTQVPLSQEESVSVRDGLQHHIFSSLRLQALGHLSLTRIICRV